MKKARVDLQLFRVGVAENIGFGFQGTALHEKVWIDVCMAEHRARHLAHTPSAFSAGWTTSGDIDASKDRAPLSLSLSLSLTHTRSRAFVGRLAVAVVDGDGDGRGSGGGGGGSVAMLQSWWRWCWSCCPPRWMVVLAVVAVVVLVVMVVLLSVIAVVVAVLLVVPSESKGLWWL